MRYVIVSIVKGPAGDFNNNLRKDIFSKYKAKSSKLPAHFTIKAPFEYNENITDLENCIEEISKKEKATPYKIDGYNHFDDRVIYMDVNMSKEAKKVHDELIDKLSTISYINFKNNDKYKFKSKLIFKFKFILKWICKKLSIQIKMYKISVV